MAENVTAYAPYNSEGNRVPVACPVNMLYDENGYGAADRKFASAVQGAKADALEAGGVYSATEEVDTGKVWIDGKPIYRKCFQRTGTLNKTYGPKTFVTTAEISSALDRVTHYEAFRDSMENGTYNGIMIFPMVCPEGVSINLQMVKKRGLELFTISIVAGSTAPEEEYNFTFIVEYTKTTDSPKGGE